MMRYVFTLIFLLSITCRVYAFVYSIDGMIDVNRMATDKMYYDLYYNTQSYIFWRGDMKAISPEAQAILQKAIESKIDRASSADYSQLSEYNTGTTGVKLLCSKDPYTGSGTEVNPEVQSPEKPGCLSGGALLADESIEYVYMIDGAYRTENAKEVTNSFRTQVYNNPVPRVFEAPSSERAYLAEHYTIHDNGNMVWRDGVPVGLGVMNWTGNCPGGYNPETGRRCFDVVNDGGSLSYTDTAYWANRTATAQMLGTVNIDSIKIDYAKMTLNENNNQNIVNRNYKFLFNNYTVTKNVQFCSSGSWDSRTGLVYSGMPDYGQNVSGSFCGGSYYCTRQGPTGCNKYDPDDPTKCIEPTYTYKCDISDACMDSNLNCLSTYNGAISVSNIPVTVTITLPGSDTRLEPPDPDKGLIYQAAEAQLPGLVQVPRKRQNYPVNHNSTIAIGSASKCDGTPSNFGPCL